MITWQLQILSLVLLGKGRRPAEIAREAGVSPYPINKAAALLRKIDKNKLQQLVDNAFEMDLKSKTLTYDLDEALKTYITTL